MGTPDRSVPSVGNRRAPAWPNASATSVNILQAHHSVGAMLGMVSGIPDLTGRVSPILYFSYPSVFDGDLQNTR
jgi:hypothetical protein